MDCRGERAQDAREGTTDGSAVDWRLRLPGEAVARTVINDEQTRCRSEGGAHGLDTKATPRLQSPPVPRLASYAAHSMQGRCPLRRARHAIVVAVLSFLSGRAFAADVFTYETGINSSWTRAGSPAASCAAYFGWVAESLVRKHAQPEWQGVCSALHFFGLEGNRCKFAGFESFGIPPQNCPPSGFPSDPHWQIFEQIVPRAVAITDKGLGQPTQHCLEGNPCDPATGNKIQVEVDYVGAGAFPLRFVRTYNWLSQGLAGNLGAKWRHNYDRRLVGSVDAIGAFRDDGAIVKFERVGSGWVPDADVTDRLEELAEGGWKLTLSAGDLVETYDASGKLLTITNRAGLTQTLSYFATGPNAGALQQISDHFGRTIQFTYTAQNYLLSLTDPEGKVIQYDYDTSAQLKSVAHPATTGPGATRTYLYQPSLPALTGIQDENGVLFASFAYDSGGLVAETKRAGDAGRIQFSYPSPSTTTVTSYVTPSITAQRTYSFETVLGIKYRTSITGAVCPTCGPRSQTFDSSTGSPTSATDWNGNKTCLAYNTRGLEEKRVEGLPSGATCPSSGGLPADAREISTQWHASYRLPTAVAEPKRITTYVYGDSNDSNPGNRGSLLSKTEQATADANGGQGFSPTPLGPGRTWEYTYNANGQVLTMDGPRTDAADVTTYTYYPNDDPDLGKRGNVATITNALGQVTEIIAYNAHGRPLTIVDPNALTTTLTYDARQRLTSRTVGAETTSYEYDGVGQMTKVTLPDGTFLAYTYDAAHRLVQIADSLGNRIAYTLDLDGQPHPRGRVRSGKPARPDPQPRLLESQPAGAGDRRDESGGPGHQLRLRQPGQRHLDHRSTEPGDGQRLRRAKPAQAADGPGERGDNLRLRRTEPARIGPRPSQQHDWLRR